MTKLTPLLKEIELEVDIDDIHRIFYDDDDVSILCNCYDERRDGYFDVIGFDPHISITARQRIALSIEIDGSKSEFTENPLLILKELLDRYDVEGEFPFPFCGGGIGYLGYELYNLLRGKGDTAYPHGALVPDLYLNFYRIFLIIDKKENKKYLLSLDYADDLEKRGENQLKRLESFEKKLNYGMIFYKDEKKMSSIPRCALDKKKVQEDINVLKNGLAAGAAVNVFYSLPYEVDYPYHGGELFSSINAETENRFSCYLQNPDFISLALAPEQQQAGDLLMFRSLREANPVLDVINKFPAASQVGVPMAEAAELIAATAESCRNIFSGMTGYLSFGGEVFLQSATEAWILKEEMLNYREGVLITKDSDCGDVMEQIRAKSNRTGIRLFK